jgi:hypothetical protein
MQLTSDWRINPPKTEHQYLLQLKYWRRMHNLYIFIKLIGFMYYKKEEFRMNISLCFHSWSVISTYNIGHIFEEEVNNWWADACQENEM